LAQAVSLKAVLAQLSIATASRGQRHCQSHILIMTANLAKRLKTAARQTLSDFTILALGSGSRDKPIQGEPIKFSQFLGKVTLIQNVASL